MSCSAFGVYTAVRLGPDKRSTSGEVLLSVPSSDGRVPPEVRALWIPGEVAICWSAPPVEIRRLSSQGLASVRGARLRRRLAKDVPLFAAEFEQRELSRRPGFFAGQESC